jgi:hypothetical protein
MCHFHVNVYTICGHTRDNVPLKCRVSELFTCLHYETTAQLVLGWCEACSRTLQRRTRRARRPKYPPSTAYLTVANYWAFKSTQGWARPVDMRTVRGRDIDSPALLPYNTAPPSGTSSGLNYEELTLLWALAQVKPDMVMLQTRFIDASVPWGWGAIHGLVRESRHLTLTEWSTYPGKEGLWSAVANGAELFERMRQEYFLTDALADGVPVWEGYVTRETETEEVGESPKVASVADDPAILHIGKVIRTL